MNCLRCTKPLQNLNLYGYCKSNPECAQLYQREWDRARAKLTLPDLLAKVLKIAWGDRMTILEAEELARSFQPEELREHLVTLTDCLGRAWRSTRNENV